MENENDYGFGELNWVELNSDNIQTALSEYQTRYENTVSDYKDIENKARWQFAVVWPLASGVTAYSLANWNGMATCAKPAIAVLAFMMWCGVVMLYFSLFSRPYKSDGFTPKNKKISDWREFLSSPKQTNRFHGMRIRHLARAISQNGKSNRAKSQYLKCASMMNLAAVPITAVIIIICYTLLGGFPFGTICPIAF